MKILTFQKCVPLPLRFQDYGKNILFKVKDQYDLTLAL